MGQYHLTVNLDKQEFLDPHRLGDGLKLVEQFQGANPGVRSALLALLACSNGRGGGDLPNGGIVGRWSGNRIAVVGDYAEPGDISCVDASEIYFDCQRSQQPEAADRFQLRNTVVGDEVRFVGGSTVYRVIRHEGRRVELEHGDCRVAAPGTLEATWARPRTWTDISVAVAAYLEKAAGGRFVESSPGGRWLDWQYDMSS